MRLNKVYQVVRDEYDHNKAVLTVAALALNLTLKPKPKDLTTPGRFTARLNKKTKVLLWEEPPDVVDLVIKIRDAWNEYEQRQTLQGLGGCVPMKLKTIVERPPVDDD